MFGRIRGRFLRQEDEDDENKLDEIGAEWGHKVEIKNDIKQEYPISADLKARSGRTKRAYGALDDVKAWDVSITKVQLNKVILQSVLPRILKVSHDREENVLNVFEVEPGQVIPP